MDTAFIFDMDGVLVDSEPLHGETKLATARHFDIPVEPAVLPAYMGRATKDFFADIMAKAGMSGKYDPAALTEYKHKLYMARAAAGGLPPVDGAFELLAELAERGIPMALASSAFRPMIDAVLDRYDLRRYFSFVISGAEIPRTKPDPAIYRLAAAGLGLPPSLNIAVVEDAASGVSAGRAAGMYVFGYRNPNSGNQDLSRAHRIVNSLRDISVADWLMNLLQ